MLMPLRRTELTPFNGRVFTSLAAGLMILSLLPGLWAQQTAVPPGTPVMITVTPGTPAPPPASLTLGARHGHVTPARCGFTHGRRQHRCRPTDFGRGHCHP